MSSFIDFEEVKKSVSLADAISILGLNLTKRGDGYRGTCPACEGSSDRALVVTPGKGWYCFHAKVGGDQIALASHIKGIPAKEAAQLLGGGTAPKEKVKVEKPGDGFKPLDYLQHDHEAVMALGLDPDVALALGLGYAPRGVLKGTVAVPLRNRDGTIAGYIGLTDVEKLPPKWELR